jgi:hypothetical protein
VYGWLSLTARGQWRLRGEPIGNRAIVEFIGRNYASDARGCWFFQNGPQRVYVALELTPWVWRIEGAALRTHTGRLPRDCRAALLLDDGRLVVDTDLGAGLIDDRDSSLLTAALVDARHRPLDAAQLERWLEGDAQAWLSAPALGLTGGACRIERLSKAALPARCGFVADPVAG